MGSERNTTRSEIPPGTLYMLILRSLRRLGPMHGYGIAQHIQQMSQEVLQVEEGSLYPALQRMLVKGWIAGEWHKTENNRRARYYRLTAAGKRQLGIEVGEFEKVVRAIANVIQSA
jgi:PadR family transcriptional regulator PadR